MRLAYESRACGVLFNILCSQGDQRPFLLPSNICPIVPITFLKAGRRFSFVDISAADLLIGKDECLQIVTESIKGYGGIIFVRTYGAEVDPGDFFCDLKSRKPDLLIIDDKCLCQPDCDGLRLAPFSDVTLFSTGYSKYVDLGFGGFAFLNDYVPYQRHAGKFTEAALSEVTQRYKDAIAKRSPFKGAKDEWLDLSEPCLSWHSYRKRLLDVLVKTEQHKQRINEIYQTALPAEIQLPESFQQWRFNIRVSKADRLVARLFEANLFASRHYSSVGGIFSERRFPRAEELHKSVVNLFNDWNLNEAQAQLATEVVMEHLDAVC